jgi:hypothetical protein
MNRIETPNLSIIWYGNVEKRVTGAPREHQAYLTAEVMGEFCEIAQKKELTICLVNDV